MKKNRAMRAASALLVAVLMTTCTISGTFAKYVTEASASDSARVAKWGVEITSTGTTFAKQYDDVAGDAGTKVKSDVKVLAPGTEGTFTKVNVSGSPEVVVDLKADVDVELANWTTTGSDLYFPVAVEIGGVAVDVTAATDMASLEVILEDAIIKALTANDVTPSANATTGRVATKQYAVGASIAHTNVDITWDWEFEGENAKDTILGNNAADANPANDPSISFAMTLTATQVD